MIDENPTPDDATPVDRLFRFRREFLARTIGLGAGLGAAGLVGSAREAEAQASVVTDPNILNFALNLEYLEAEFYTLAVFGMTIEQMGVAVNGAGTVGGLIVKASPKVPFVTPSFLGYATEIAGDEIAHVKFLRAALLGAGVQPVARPTIDLLNSFNGAAAAAGLGASFDPFADENSFLIGAFVFEDVGVTAYHGAARFIKNKDYLDAAAGILAVEAYHAAEVRTLMVARGLQAPANALSNLRGTLSAQVPPNTSADQGIGDPNNINIVPTDGNSLAFDRNTSQVLNIVYSGGFASGAGGGGFFPAGMNGAIR